MRASRTTPITLIAAVAAAGLLASACGEPKPARPEEPEAAYAGCRPGAAEPLPVLVCQAWERALAEGQRAGAAEGAAHVARRTEDGYRLRRTMSLVLLGVGLWVVGGMLAAFLTSRRRGAAATGHARAAFEALEREADRARALAKGGDPLVAQLVDRIRGPLAETERQARQIVNLCEPLEVARVEDADAAARAQLESYYRKLDELIGRVERLRVQLSVWQERLATETTSALEDEVQAAIADLGAAMEELA